MKYLAIGTLGDTGGCTPCVFSRFVSYTKGDDPNIVAEYLQRESGNSFDSIILLENGKTVPRIVENWHWRDFTSYEELDLDVPYTKPAWAQSNPPGMLNVKPGDAGFISSHQTED